jgi:hypothetical protein
MGKREGEEGERVQAKACTGASRASSGRAHRVRGHAVACTGRVRSGFQRARVRLGRAQAVSLCTRDAI